MRQQPRLSQHRLARLCRVLRRARASQLPQSLSRILPRRLGSITKRQQTLRRPRRRASSRHVDDFLERHVHALSSRARFVVDERAVSARVPTRARERNEHLGRVRHDVRIRRSRRRRRRVPSEAADVVE